MVVFHIFDCLRPRKLKDELPSYKEDCISGLPNDILIRIVSLLPQKEAARTCILSKHWQKVQSFCGRFDFDSEAILGIPYRYDCWSKSKSKSKEEKRKYRKWLELITPKDYQEYRNEEKRRYKEWVNKVVRSADDATAIDEFRVRFNLDSSSREEMDEWLSCAFARKVKRLELDLISWDYHHSLMVPLIYEFPVKLLLNKSSTNWLLTSLTLIAVKVSGEDVKVFLQTFRFLEFLEVSQSPTLVRVEIYGPSLALKHLVIRRDVQGPSRDIRPKSGKGSMIIRDASCLETLESDDWFMHNLEVENAPNLVKARLPGYGWFVNKVAELDPIHYYSVFLLASMQALPDHPAFFSRLQLLTLDVVSAAFHCGMVTRVPAQLTQLKHLNLNVLSDESFIYLTPLLKECPNLEKLVIKVHRINGRSEMDRIYGTEPAANFCLRHLKTVEYLGYAGCSGEDEFVTILLENAVSLQTLTLEIDNTIIFREEKKLAKRLAEKLKRSVICSFPSLEFLIVYVELFCTDRKLDVLACLR